MGFRERRMLAIDAKKHEYAEALDESNTTSSWTDCEGCGDAEDIAFGSGILVMSGASRLSGTIVQR